MGISVSWGELPSMKLCSTLCRQEKRLSISSLLHAGGIGFQLVNTSHRPELKPKNRSATRVHSESLDPSNFRQSTRPTLREQDVWWHGCTISIHGLWPRQHLPTPNGKSKIGVEACPDREHGVSHEQVRKALVDLNWPSVCWTCPTKTQSPHRIQ